MLFSVLICLTNEHLLILRKHFCCQYFALTNQVHFNVTFTFDQLFVS